MIEITINGNRNIIKEDTIRHLELVKNERTDFYDRILNLLKISGVYSYLGIISIKNEGDKNKIISDIINGGSKDNSLHGVVYFAPNELIRDEVCNLFTNCINTSVYNPNDAHTYKNIVGTYDDFKSDNMISMCKDYLYEKYMMDSFRIKVTSSKLIILDGLPTLEFKDLIRVIRIIKYISNATCNIIILTDRCLTNEITVEPLDINNESDKPVFNANKYLENTNKAKSKEFKISGIDNLTYPYTIYKNNKEYNLYKLFVSKNSESKFSRSYHLNNRSTQEKLMDLLVQIDYFGVKIHKEVPFIVYGIPGKIYYMADYYIPECNMIIELDSDYHDIYSDCIRDKYMKLIGIETILRLKNFTASNKELKMIKSHISANKSDSVLHINFNDLSHDSLTRINEIINNKNKTIEKKNDKILLIGDKILYKVIREIFNGMTNIMYRESLDDIDISYNNMKLLMNQ